MRIFTAFLLLITCSIGTAQTFVLSGKVTDGKDPLPFATIMVKGTGLGTNSNLNGDFLLRLAPGKYDIIFQYVGYDKKTETVQLNADKILNVTLSSNGVSLNAVDVTAGEDPANPIMREAIKKRKYYLHQVQEYSCKSYIKGLQKINQIPKSILKLIKFSGGSASDTNEMKGVVYLSESESRYHFRQPSQVKEIMFSSKVSGDNKAFSFNQLSEMKMDFYQNLIDINEIANSPFISPVSDNAFSYYKFYLLGSNNTDDGLIYKIKVVPKRKTDPCFSGIIYIQDKAWRITSLDFVLTKENKIKYVDTLSVRQLYAPVASDSVWLPVNLNFGFAFGFFGFKGNGLFNAIISDYDLTPHTEKNFFNNEILKVEDGANKKDSAYWAANRVVPLTAEEIADYREKDSIAKVRSSKRYKDSVDKLHNKFTLSKLLMGYNWQNSHKQTSVSLPGLITNGVQYNTVEGLNLSYRFYAQKTWENFRYLSVEGKVRYGFSNQLWGGLAAAGYIFKPVKFSRIGFSVKSMVEQFNQQEPISPLVNTGYTLLMNENYMKLYKENAVASWFFTELVNGVYMNAHVQYALRDPLKNTTDLLLIDHPKKLFTSNDPQYPYTEDSAFKSNNAFTTELSFSIRFRQKYYTLPGQKIISGSKYPRVGFSWKKAIPLKAGDADFDLVSTSIYDRIRLGLAGDLTWRVRAGYFVRSHQMYFMDYKHFQGNQTYFSTQDNLNVFRLLPYYSVSSNKWYAEAHAEHHFNGFLINKIPLLRKLNVQEVLGAHVLSNERIKYYYEFNFGIERLFKVVRLDYVIGHAPESKPRHGFMIGFNFNF